MPFLLKNVYLWPNFSCLSEMIFFPISSSVMLQVLSDILGFCESSNLSSYTAAKIFAIYLLSFIWSKGFSVMILFSSLYAAVENWTESTERWETLKRKTFLLSPQSWFLWQGIWIHSSRCVIEIGKLKNKRITVDKEQTAEKVLKVFLAKHYWKYYYRTPRTPTAPPWGLPVQHVSNRNVRPRSRRRLEWDWADRLGRIHRRGRGRWGTNSEMPEWKHNIESWQTTNSIFVFFFFFF